MSIQKLKAYLKEYSYLRSIENLLEWDMETMMPLGAVEDRAARLSYVRGKLHSHVTAKEYAGLLEDLRGTELSPQETRLLDELLWDYELKCTLPQQHVETLAHVQAIASHAWTNAKQANDWDGFRPHFEQLLELKRKETTFFSVERPYDALLRMFDKEFTSAEITRLFAELKAGLLALTAKVNADGRFVTARPLPGPFDLKAQRALSGYIARLMGLSKDLSRLDVSSHPFSINISPRDQRITTKYDQANLDSMASTMHEVGHALYESNLPAEWEGTPFAEAASISMHESQSRFWENVVGRSREFCSFIHPELENMFPENMAGISSEHLFMALNKSVPGLLRVASCELYYNLHVIIRYEIEELLFNHDLDVAELPSIWAEKHMAYLGIAPQRHRDGVLQDGHWAQGAFGYFPTYTLGNLICGSLLARMAAELPTMRSDIAEGNFSAMRTWLAEHIHSKGRSITSRDVVGELHSGDYLRYLGDKLAS